MNDLLFRALHVASDYHWLKFRKDGKTPYIVHPIEVARFLQKDCQVEDDDIIAIAFLHDTIEDTEATKEELAKLFGEKIANVVDELTFYEDSTSKQYYLDNFHLKSDKAVIVKCAR